MGQYEKSGIIKQVEIVTDASTKKYVFELSDGKYIEMVCIKRRTGTTACISTQVGCPVRCIFCQSGKNGLNRNLTASEIVEQVLFVKDKVNRIVFMGIGEPLYNYDALIEAIHILRDRDGINFPTDGITISTVGPIKQLKKLREEHLKIQLVLSLHATTQKVRDYIIPGMRGKHIGQSEVVAAPKTRSSVRTIKAPPIVLDVLKDWKAHIDKACPSHDVFIFCTRNGKCRTYAGLRSALRRFLDKQGLENEKLHLHSFRHTFATMLLENSVNPRVVQRLLGHADIGTTLGTYSHVVQEVYNEVAEVLGNIYNHTVDGTYLPRVTGDNIIRLTRDVMQESAV